MVYLIPTVMEFKNNKIEINELLINESQDLSYKRIPSFILVLLNMIGVSITVSRFIWNIKIIRFYSNIIVMIIYI